MANDMHHNSEHSSFFNYMQSRRKGSNDLIVIKMDNGNVLTNERDIAEQTNECFASVFTAENFDNFPSPIKLSMTRILVLYTVHLRMLARF